MLGENRRTSIVWRLVYSYILVIRRYAPNTFLALPNFRKRQILANTVCESQFSQLLVNLCENARECYEYSEFAYSRSFSENRRMCGSTLKSVNSWWRTVILNFRQICVWTIKSRSEWWFLELWWKDDEYYW